MGLRLLAPTGQWVPYRLLVQGTSFQELSGAAAADKGEQSHWACAFKHPQCSVPTCAGVQNQEEQLLKIWEKKASKCVASVTHRSVGALGSAFVGAWVSRG